MSVTRFSNCRVLRGGRLSRECVWVRAGRVLDPERVFYEERARADRTVDCGGLILAPGYVELQINGGFGIDFSDDKIITEDGINRVAKGLLAHGVTSFCPTLVTSPVSSYHNILSKIKKRNGGKDGATILGVHLEGPFISKDKKGAHPVDCIRTLDKGMDTVYEVYGSLDNVAIVTLAPELANAGEVIKSLTELGITVSLGHSMSNLSIGESGVHHGAKFITHLFNAMLPFHHRDPGLVGLLASDCLPEGKEIYFGIISDGCHTHPAALRIAHRTHPKGLVLVSDAISPLGLSEGRHKIGQLEVDLRDNRAYVSGTNTLCGSISALDFCVKTFYDSTGCSIEYALEAASLHPARTLGIENMKGSLAFGCDADFILLDSELAVQSTWIAGKCVYQRN